VDQQCPICGNTMNALQNQPLTDDPEVLGRRFDALSRRLGDVQEGRARPEEVQNEVPKLCAGCRGLLGGITGRASREELIQHLGLHRRQIEARLEAMEQNLPPTAEGRPQRRGPGDRAA
jgi:hypothetical protein